LSLADDEKWQFVLKGKKIKKVTTIGRGTFSNLPSVLERETITPEELDPEISEQTPHCDLNTCAVW